MFYSHEKDGKSDKHTVLTMEQYGVSTVWLVSTVGLKSNSRKVTRKTIQEVNVQRACETIQHPGAPIALRLQGSLLFGVSKVYSQQCTYVLGDAEKMQQNIYTFHHTPHLRNTLDPGGNKAKRNQLIIMDDPAFDLNSDLPSFHLDGDDLLQVSQQNSGKTWSQMSPFSLAASASAASFAHLDIPSSVARNTYQLEMPFGPDLMDEQGNHEDTAMTRKGEDPDDFDLNLGLDTDSIMATMTHEPELPKLPPVPGSEHVEGADRSGHKSDVVLLDHDGDMVMKLGDDHMHASCTHTAAPAAPLEQAAAAQEQSTSDAAEAPAQQGRKRRRALLAPDADTKISRQELRDWGLGYVEMMERGRKASRAKSAKRRQNAYDCLLGYGIGNVGMPTGIPGYTHPLGDLFAHEGLANLLLGYLPSDESSELESPRARRRSADDALEPEDERTRRVRARLSSEPDRLGRAQDEGRLNLDDVELGREAAPPLPDMGSDVPWNRPSSQIASSAIKASAQRPHLAARPVSASPLHGRGSIVPEIERFSDQLTLGSDTLNPFSAGDHGLSDSPAGRRGAAILSPTHAALDGEGHNFLGYVADVAMAKGERREEAGRRRQWVDFDDLFEERDRTRLVVTSAFYHVLQMATKHIVKVEQEGENEVPFGTIRVGVLLADDLVTSSPA